MIKWRLAFEPPFYSAMITLIILIAGLTALKLIMLLIYCLLEIIRRKEHREMLHRIVIFADIEEYAAEYNCKYQDHRKNSIKSMIFSEDQAEQY